MTKKIKKRILYVFITGCVFLSIFIIVPSFFRFIFTGTPLPAPGAFRMERFLQRNYVHLNLVAEYLINADIERATIRRNQNNDVYISVGRHRREITDENVLHSLRRLRRRGIRTININDQVITFLRWTNLDAGRGIVYSINGDTPDASAFEFLTYISSLSIDGWYFFIEDFNVWRRENR